MLEDAQKQAGRAGRTIANETLLLFASTEILTTERYPQANNDWEDRSEVNKKWANWKTDYKRVHAKERVKAQATEGSDKFGVANTSARIQNSSKAETNQGGNEVVMKSLEGYFDNLADAAVNEKSVLEQLVANNATLAATNEELVTIVKNCPTR